MQKCGRASELFKIIFPWKRLKIRRTVTNFYLLKKDTNNTLTIQLNTRTIQFCYLS